MASAQATAVVDQRGTTSSQRVERSMTVRICVYPSLDVGSGPTRLAWMWEKRRLGMGIETGAAVNWRVTLLR